MAFQGVNVRWMCKHANAHKSRAETKDGKAALAASLEVLSGMSSVSRHTYSVYGSKVQKSEKLWNACLWLDSVDSVERPECEADSRSQSMLGSARSETRYVPSRP